MDRWEHFGQRQHPNRLYIKVDTEIKGKRKNGKEKRKKKKRKGKESKRGWGES